jgi:putative ABC transport system permease protein
VKQILRSWRNSPGFTAIILMILAVGIGSTTAIFSLVYGILLKPYPFAEPEQLFVIQTTSSKFRGAPRPVSLADFDDLQRTATQISGMAAYRLDRFSLLESNVAQPIQYARVSPSIFPVLGVAPLLGQPFQASDDQPGGQANKAILSHALWKRLFAADPSVIGRTIRTSVTPLTIVGVMPASFQFPDNVQMWVPLQSLLNVRHLKRTEDRQYRQLSVVARLKAGSSLTAAQAELDQLGRDLERTYPVSNESMRPTAVPLRDALTGDVRPYLWLLFASVLLVLGICTANSANLFLARAAARAREFSIRSALGADPSRIIRDQLLECLALSTVGGLLGLLLAKALLEAFPRFAANQIPAWISVQLDLPALAFSFVLALLTGATFGLMPALMAARVDLNTVLKEGVRGSSGAGRVKKGLVIAEVALASVLLVGAGLLLRTLSQLQSVDLGFNTSNLYTVKITPFVPGAEKERILLSSKYFERVTNRLRQIPGVVEVGGTDDYPFTPSQATGRPTLQLEAKGDLNIESFQRQPSALIDITPGYFDALGIPLLEGRAFRESDDLANPWVIILSERAAKAFFPGRSALGQQVRTNTAGATDPWATVVGVVGNVKYRANESDRSLEFYYPYKQYGLSTTYIGVRLQRDRPGIEQEIRAAVQSVDVETPVEDIRPMRSLIDETLWQQRLWGLLLGSFAVTALVLSLLGLYGVLAFSVSQRVREIGIRMAIGARPSQVISLIVGDGLHLVSIGLAVGLVASLALGRWLAAFLFQVSWLDPLTYFAVLFLIPLAGLLAAALPAWRAVRVDPLNTLRSD